jgi:hypothetical protein
MPLESISLYLWRERVGRGNVVDGKLPFIHLLGPPDLTEEIGNPLSCSVGTFRTERETRKVRLTFFNTKYRIIDINLKFIL